MFLLDPQRKRRNILILLVLTAVTLMTFSYQGFSPLASLRSSIRAAFDPAVAGSNTLTSPFTNAWTSITEYSKIKEENEALKRELSHYRSTKMTSAAAQDTLNVLLKEVDIDYIGGAETLLAQVNERPGNFASYSLELDRGTSHGVRVGMPVVSSQGLIGRITEVSRSSSKLRLIEHPDFPLGIRVVGTGEVALARGSGFDAELIVTEGLNEKSDVKAGDYVVTSGIEGSSYPPDLAVGTVSAVEFDDTLLQQTVRVDPIADMSDLRFATIILWTVDEGSSEPTDTSGSTSGDGGETDSGDEGGS